MSLPVTVANCRTAAALATGLALLVGCATPAQRFERRASELGLSAISVAGTGFRHRVYARPAVLRQLTAGASPAPRLHVYLGSDGTPYLRGRFVNADPTPRQPLALELLAQDRADALYLGRPCYHRLTRSDPGCTPALWTGARYGTAVVASLEAALTRLRRRGGYRQLLLIGYSGGGALARLLAARLPETRALITLAGNLDPPRWAAWHGYAPLSGSLNPARLPPLPARVYQAHYSGADDRNVPPTLLREALAGQPEARVIELAGFDHHCCWRARWPALLRTLPAD
jgi:hypothetical protein